MRPHLASPLSSACDGDHKMSEFNRGARRCRLRVIRVGLTTCHPLPVFSGQQTLSVSGGMSQRCPSSDIAQSLSATFESYRLRQDRTLYKMKLGASSGEKAPVVGSSRQGPELSGRAPTFFACGVAWHITQSLLECGADFTLRKIAIPISQFIACNYCICRSSL